jgi:hypothetical protein
MSDVQTDLSARSSLRYQSPELFSLSTTVALWWCLALEMVVLVWFRRRGGQQDSKAEMSYMQEEDEYMAAQGHRSP